LTWAHHTTLFARLTACEGFHSAYAKKFVAHTSARRKGETVDVEHDTAEAAGMQARDARPPSGEGAQQWRKAPIGALLEEVRDRLLFLGDELGKHVDEPAVPLLLETQRQLREVACRIAIIGQVKAGKSTFVNALVESPALLPSDINPSTVVVTTLNFRNSTRAPEHAAVFQFFSSEEWSDLAEGGGNLRRLTERLVPGFKPNLLRAHLDFVRSRAARRLGARFHELLGQSHYYKELKPEVLADYISAGDYQEAGAAQRPHFSDITRSAQLFFSQGPFAFPVTLIDTPGNNDPFLVRDEITRRVLDSPDIFVCVLSALQPLSAADIATLRLLSGLQKDRIVVFINRADQLDDPIADGAAIKSAVERRLRLEFPAIDIPVVIGSSWWGSLGILAEHVDLRAELGPSQFSVLAKAEMHGSVAGDPAASLDPSRLGRTLYERSGMPQVAAAITRSMASSGAAILLRQIAACFLEIAKSTDIFAKAELQSIEQHLAARQMEARMLSEKIAEEQEALRLFEERAGALRATFKQIETHFTELIDNGTESLRGDLQRLVHEFSDQQAHMVTLSQGTRTPRKPRQCNVMPLRVRLETAYLSAFDKLAGDLVRIESFLYPQLKTIVANLVSDVPSGYLEPPTEPMQPIPSAPLSATIALDLDERWWKLWFGTKATPQEQADHLRDLIDAEFAAVVDELARLAQMRLAERTDHTLKRLAAVSDGLLAGIEARKSLLAAEYDRLNGIGNEQSLQRSDSELSQRMHACAAARTACALLSDELARLLQTLETAAAGAQTSEMNIQTAGA
jgi:Dynamin family